MPSDIEKYQGLIELILDFNGFKKVPKVLTKCKRLCRLSIASNSLSELRYVEYFKKLRFLIINCNDLTQLDENLKVPIRSYAFHLFIFIYKYIGSLKTDLKHLDKLELLDASHNKIEYIHPNLFKASMVSLKHLDLSYCKLQSITSELFMLGHLEVLNLSNNQLSKLPTMPLNYFRPICIFSLDLSYNQLFRFYDYLLVLAQNIDLTSNKIKNISSKSIDKYTLSEIESKNLILKENPLIDPPPELCRYGLKMIKGKQMCVYVSFLRDIYSITLNDRLEDFTKFFGSVH